MSVASLHRRLQARPASVPIDLERIRRVVRSARAAGRRRLLEPEGMELLGAIGVPTPRASFLPLGQPVASADLANLATERVVVKVVSESIVHKTEVGGVAIVERRSEDIHAAIAAMVGRLRGERLAGFLVSELVEHERSLGGELLVSVRWTEEFGPVVTVGAGGIHAELLARDLRPGLELAAVSPHLTEPEGLARVLGRATAVRLATEPQRGRPPLASMADLVHLVSRFLALGESCVPDPVAECEVNPIVATESGLVALDVLVTLGESREGTAAVERPVRKMPCLLEPRSIAIAGVSSGENPGRTILRNILRDGFDRDRVVVVKPGLDTIDGCRCVPDVAALPGKVDLFVVALAATRAVAMVEEVVRQDAAESLIVIPGGLEEKAGGGALAARMRSALAEARHRPGGGPLINGGNCLGIRSRPGRYDTLFIPAAKLAPPSGHPVPLAIVAQSGAFAISRLSRLVALDPKYVITVGNQLDVTIGDYLDHLADDRDVLVVGVYVEGFAPLDGRRVLLAARAIAARGGIVVLYRAGRTRAGARASASHTASIAGDAVVTAALSRQAGVVVADTLEAFDDLLRTFTLLSGRAVGGRRLGAVSNAGFECVTVADTLRSLELASFEPSTESRLGEVLRRAGAGDVVDIHDPVDLTPMLDDAAFAEAAEAVLASDSVDVGLVGVVPFTAALQTLPPGTGGEDLQAPGAVADRLIALWRRTTKAWVAVVDGGPAYDPFAGELEAGGIPTFRTADAALSALEAVVEARMGRPSA